MSDEKREVLKKDISFPSNSHRDKEKEKEEPRKLEKVIKGKVIQKKKSLGKKFVETFINEDIDNVGSYVMYDVLIPAAKNLMVDMFHGSVDMIFGEQKRGSRTRRDRDKSYVSYDRYSDRDKRSDRDRSSVNRARHSFDDVILSSRGEAEEVLSTLVDLTIDYGQATVSDLYELVGITGNFTDNKYGWEDLSSASVNRVREGYALNLPKAIVLE